MVDEEGADRDLELVEHPSHTPQSRADWGEVADRLLKRYQRTGRLDLLAEAINTLRREAEATLTKGGQREPAVFYRLAGALWIRFQRSGGSADLAEAIEAGRRAVEAANDHPQRSVMLADLGAILWTRFEQLGHLADMAESIDVRRLAVAIAPQVADPEEDRFVANLAEALWYRFQRFGAPADLTEAVDLFRRSVRMTVRGHPDRPARLYNLAVALNRRFEQQGEPADLEEAVESGYAAAAEAADDDPHRVTYLMDGGAALQQRSLATGDTADLDAAVDLLRAAVASADVRGFPWPSARLAVALHMRFLSTGNQVDRADALTAMERATEAAGDPADAASLADLLALLRSDPDAGGSDADQASGEPSDRSAVLADQGVARWERYTASGYERDLTEAVDLLRASVALTTDGDPENATRLSFLLIVLQARFERTRDPADLTEAIEAGRRAVRDPRVGGIDQARGLSNLGVLLRQRFELATDPADLAEAVDLARRAAAADPADDPERVTLLANLSRVLAMRVWGGGPPHELDEAIEVQRSVVALASDRRDRAGYSHALTVLLQERFSRTGEIGNLHEAVEISVQATGSTPRHNREYSLRHLVLGQVLRVRYERLGDLTDLDRSIEAHRRAVEQIAETHPERAQYLTHLGHALRDRHAATGDVSDLTEAIDAFRWAASATPEGDPDTADRLTNLGVTLQDRYGRLDNPADLADAIEILRRAASGRNDRPGHADRLSNLAAVLSQQFGADGTLSNLTEAIDLLRRAASLATGDDAHRTGYLANLGPALVYRFRATEDPDDLAAASDAVHQALAGTPEGDPHKAGWFANLGEIRTAQFEADDDMGNLTGAVDMFDKAVAASLAGSPACARHLLQLGRALRRRFEQTGELPDGHRALDAFRTSAQIPAATPRIRADSAQAWGKLAGKLNDSRGAADGYAAAVHALPELTWRGVSRGQREQTVQNWAGLACSAAAWAIRADRPEQAVELLEQGRCVLWAQALQLRTDLDELAADAPDLARRLAELRALIESADLSRGEHYAGGDQMRLVHRYEALLAEIRQLPDFRNFLRPTPFAELSAAAQGGTAVILNVSVDGCHALAVTPGKVTVVPLPGLDAAGAATRANTYLDALMRMQAAPPDIAAAASAKSNLRTALSETASWTWESCARPVLDALGHTGPPPEGTEWPRIWWCPTGPLTILPIHAAGDPGGADDAVIERVVSSYAPTLAALHRSRRDPAANRPYEPLRVLTVGLPVTPTPPGLPSLPGVDRELDLIARHVTKPAPERCVGAAATRREILDLLPGHPWVHLACHGGQDLTDPAKGAVYLHDGPLTVLEIAAQRLIGAEFVFLSACQTAIGGVRLADEALHLAAAFQLAGYRHVIATQWTISDMHAPEITEAVYRALTSDGALDPSGAAMALHHAVSRFRTTHRDDVHLWAPYIHVGP